MWISFLLLVAVIAAAIAASRRGPNRRTGASRQAMKAALKARLVPALRERGFRGSLPHFRRLGDDRIDLLTVQFDRHGGGFVVELGQCEPAGLKTTSGEVILPEKVTAWHLHPRDRHRLGSPEPGKDGHWFRYDDGTTYAEAAADVVSLLDEADDWWDDG